MGLAVGFAPTAALRPATEAFAPARRSQGDRLEPPGGGPLALMRHVYVAESDERARAEMTDDLLRLGQLQPQAQGHRVAGGPGSRADRRAQAAAEVDALVRDEIFIAGGPATAAAGIAAAQRVLGVNVLLANVYAAGVDDERVRRTMRLLAGEVADRLAGEAATRVVSGH